MKHFLHSHPTIFDIDDNARVRVVYFTKKMNSLLSKAVICRLVVFLKDIYELATSCARSLVLFCASSSEKKAQVFRFGTHICENFLARPVYVHRNLLPSQCLNGKLAQSCDILNLSDVFHLLHKLIKKFSERPSIHAVCRNEEFCLLYLNNTRICQLVYKIEHLLFAFGKYRAHFFYMLYFQMNKTYIQYYILARFKLGFTATQFSYGIV